MVALGDDPTTIAAEFVAAMRPIAGDNVDLQPVQANLGALGLAVYRTLTVAAETVSDDRTDAAFWEWVRQVQAWIDGVRHAVDGWTPVTPAEKALKLALTEIPAPQAAPSGVKGRIS